MVDQKGRFVIENYGTKGEFASFLPGISGMYGIPIWCYYVNRGQCVSSFGVQDKDHSIMEFFPAHQAYARAKKMGFRTLIKVDGHVAEPFQCEKKKHTMYIGMNELELQEQDTENELETAVTYITLPGEAVGGLVRRVCIRNTSGQTRRLEVLDGIPEVIPYGVSLDSMKTMGQTIKAWMEVKNRETGIPFFHVRASTEDSAQVTEIEGGNYGLAMDASGQRLPVIVDAKQIFSYDSSLAVPVVLEDSSLADILNRDQATQNQIPCCFFAKAAKLALGEELVIYELFGQAKTKEVLKAFEKSISGPEFFEQKFKDARSLTDEITDLIATKTGNAVFDQYCRQTFLDNVLRGGYPVLLGGNKLFYLYSRKHGDMERDYNYFSMLPEFFSQGNGNFRDVNQNRRCDVQFAPFTGDKNIKTFYNCIQINGYNPLGIEKITYHAHVEGFQDSFTPGELYTYLEGVTDSREELENRFAKILSEAEYEDRTRFGEGYWTDHWTYNLDLVESYLSVYPEREKELLFEDRSYVYLQAEKEILPRSKRYVKTEKGIRQYCFLADNPVKKAKESGENASDECRDMPGNTSDAQKGTAADQMYLVDARGNTVKSTLAEKLFLLCTVKTAALDAYGMGVEMEGGKPGWYDALNGLPGLLGSSMCETYEVARMLSFTIHGLEKYQESLYLPEETAQLARSISCVIQEEKPYNKDGEVISYWNRVCDAKEAYWKSVQTCISGAVAEVSREEALDILKQMQTVVLWGIEKAFICGKGISPAYFYYEVTSYTEDEEGIHPTAMKQHMLPYFLEGPVRHMKLQMENGRRKTLYKNVKSSGLYDERLQMYKVNASIMDTTFELGRCRAFTPGWLENESIWLHMEYKYLLELLKSGLYEEFAEDFHKAAIPFLDKDTYGRSLFENSSFIASSANPDPQIHGKGFVARLSGSTAEFLQMWQIMMFGYRPFRSDGETLTLEFAPLIPSYLIGDDKCVEAVFLGKTKVVYHLCDKNDFIPGSYVVKEIAITGKDGVCEWKAGQIPDETSRLIRDGWANKIEVYLDRSM